MAVRIQVKRGTKANLPTLATGECGLATDTGEFFIGGADGNIQIPALGTDGKIPAGQIPDLSYDPSGTATTAVAAHNTAEDAHTALFAAKQDKALDITASLTASGWSDNEQTVAVSGVTAASIVFVAPPASAQEAYTEAGVVCTAQGAGTLTFSCTNTPDTDISVNVVILN